MREVRLKIATICLLSVMFCGVVFGVLIVRADDRTGAEVGDGGGVNGGSCAPDGKTSWNDTCFGYTWRKGPVTSDSMYFAGTDHVASGTLNGCVSIGANEYFRLGMERYNPTEYKNSGDANAASLGSHVGAILPSIAAGKIRNDIDGTYSESEVRTAFYIAAKLDNDGNDLTINGKTYDQAPSFCWNEAWLCPEDDPDCVPPTPTPSVTGPYFQSKSKVDVGDGVPAGDNVQESSWDGSTSIEFSTDDPSVEIKFTHTIDYQPNGFTMNTSSGDTFTTKASAGDSTDVADTKNNYTPYTITTTGAASTTGDSNAYTTSTGSEEHAVDTQTVHLNPGETKTVCSVISYDQKHASVKSKEHVTQEYKAPTLANPSGQQKISHNDWYNDDYSGSGRSSACATITRPSDPTGEPKNPNASGTTTSNIMFAGETTNLEWGIQASTWDTRRLMERQVTAHLVDAIAGNSSRFFTGSSRSGSDPHSYYSGSNIVDRHNFGSEGANLNNSADTYSRVFGVVVPDYVGYKYCHSAGYRYESWYSINGTWKQDTRDGKNYWYVYNASCRTIAKKPTVAIWNSNMMTAGGITTSSSPRFDNPIMGTESGAGGSKTLYGAWVEHLAAIGRNVTYFGSGSSFAIGSKNLAAPKSNPLTLDNSTLTISNNGKLGSSGIFNNSTYRTRLTTFLENQATRPGGSELGTMSNVSDTRILRYDGNLKITGNITTAPGPYNSIYHVPQVMIFVHGDLEIASDVTRIDAWLIVDGKINTCSEFQSGLTEADAISRLRDTCNKQLVFNGPVLANNLVLTRSFGADPLITRTGTFGTASTRQAAGEVFNLRADTYLWAYAQAGRYDSSYTESYTRELAPRY